MAQDGLESVSAQKAPIAARFKPIRWKIELVCVHLWQQGG
ncbi:hypothetical protein BRCON_2656 [Candidatus Sumerlaea chitinivorans]|uniref:Uncharacterized protein n=1 Tax=Sumerlaea chitinivorans TaxID=2250252 RepID=A0A2Z4Y998_SUMC1|nr:hypothetical protein BRCON_2656 [Candidatus Sumerlaea chitinivorans]